ncbi:MAG: manganese efflux pump MntP family protein [Clostridia bacterium]|nr:manganese efflux pump MntP family protein [Clostridia bacterium]
MSLLTLLFLAVALGADAFSLAIGIGVAGIRRKQIWIISLTVLVFHVFMPLAGYMVGEAFSSLGRLAGITGALVLIFLGAKMAKESLDGKGFDEEPHFVIANTWGLVLLAGSVSLDALSVGFTLGTQNVYLGLAVGVMGTVAGLMTAAGLVFGKYLGQWVGSKAEIIGGLVLIGIGVKLAYSL